jgi:hypothetical protein
VKPLFGGDERVLFRGNAYDESYNPLGGVDIKLGVTDAAGRTTDYFLRETAPGVYGEELTNLPEGTYRYTATGRKDGREIGTDRGEFSVGSSALEYIRLQADAELLRQLATRTEGTFRTARNLPQLAQDILAAPTVKPLVTERRTTAPLHRLLLPLLLVLALLSTEWVLRKRNGLL